MATSSLSPEEDPLGSILAGGEVVRTPPVLLDSENVSQNVLPLEFFIACCLKLLDNPIVMSPIISSSATSSRGSCCVRLGEDGAVVL